MRVDFYSPLPPERSGVADYSEFLLPALRPRIDVNARRRRGEREPGGDLALYHVGNDPRRHGWIVEALQHRAGVVVLHEVGLHELVAGMTVARGDKATYLDAVEQDGGREARLLAQGSLSGLLPPLWDTRPLDYPLLDGVLDHALGVVVHSRFAAEFVRGRGYDGPVWRVPFPGYPAAEVEVEVEGGLVDASSFPVVASLGAVTGAKRIPQLLRAFARLRRTYSAAVLVLAGAGHALLRLESRLERLGLRLGRDVLALGHVTDVEFSSLLRRADICVSLRWPTLGETSASVIRALSLGRCVVVSDVGWYAELPDSVAVKVRPDEREVAMLATALEFLAGDDALRRSMGAAAGRYAASEHHVDRAAEAFVRALRATASAAKDRSVGRNAAT